MLAALAVSAPWYLRNWTVHGWPLWPFSQGPTGDPLPHAMSLFSASFLSRPRVSFDATPGAYLQNVGGGVALIIGALAAPVLSRRRAVLGASLLALLTLITWGLAPFTGLSPSPLLGGLAITTVRYLQSALVMCLVAVSLLHRPGASPVARRWAESSTLIAVVGSLIADGEFGYPAIPRPWLALLGAAVGVAAPHLTHRLELIGPDESCARTLARLDRGWIVIDPHQMGLGILANFRAAPCLAGRRPLYDDGTTVIYAPRPRRDAASPVHG